MSSEDNFLSLDPFNYDTELESLLATGSLSLDDVTALYEIGAISKEEFEECKEYFDTRMDGED